MRLIALLKAISVDQYGGTAIEYGLILAMVFLAMLGAVQGFGNELVNMFDNVSSQSVSAMAGAV